MAQTKTPRQKAKIDPTDVREGDRVFLGIQLHGTSDDIGPVEYRTDILRSGVEGTVTEALSERERELVDEGERIMANLKVETDDERTFTWQVDNGYVVGWKDTHDRHTDLGHFGGIYETK